MSISWQGWITTKMHHLKSPIHGNYQKTIFLRKPLWVHDYSTLNLNSKDEGQVKKSSSHKYSYAGSILTHSPSSHYFLPSRHQMVFFVCCCHMQNKIRMRPTKHSQHIRSLPAALSLASRCPPWAAPAGISVLQSFHVYMRVLPLSLLCRR